MKILSGILLTFLAFTAAAQSHIDVQTTVQKEEVFLNDTGEEEKRLVPAEKVLPGETVYYTITFTNTSDEVADKQLNERTDITNPVIGEEHRLALTEAGLVLREIGILKPDVDVEAVVDSLIDSSYITKVAAR